MMIKDKAIKPPFSNSNNQIYFGSAIKPVPQVESRTINSNSIY